MTTHNWAYRFRLQLPGGCKALDLGVMAQELAALPDSLTTTLQDKKKPLKVGLNHRKRGRHECAARGGSCTMMLYQGGSGDVHGAKDARTVYRLAAAACTAARGALDDESVHCTLPSLTLRQATLVMGGHIHLDELVLALRGRDDGVTAMMLDVRTRRAKVCVPLREPDYPPDDEDARLAVANEVAGRHARFVPPMRLQKTDPARKLTFIVFESGSVNVLGNSVRTAAHDACIERGRVLIEPYVYAPAEPGAHPLPAAARKHLAETARLLRARPAP